MTMSPKGEKRTAQIEVEDLHAEARGRSSGSVGPPVPDISSGAPAGSSLDPQGRQDQKSPTKRCFIFAHS